MNKIFIICLFGIVGISCSAQVDSIKKDSALSNSELLIDPIEEMPFIIERESQYVQLPDSLGGNTITGLAFLGLFINQEAKVKQFTIIRLNLTKGENIVVDYLNTKSECPLRENDYPVGVKRYYKFFTEYIANLKIAPMPNAKPKEVTIINLPLRFR